MPRYIDWSTACKYHDAVARFLDSENVYLVRVPRDVDPYGRICVLADAMTVKDGALLFFDTDLCELNGLEVTEERSVFILPAGKWLGVSITYATQGTEHVATGAVLRELDVARESANNALEDCANDTSADSVATHPTEAL